MPADQVPANFWAELSLSFGQVWPGFADFEMSNPAQVWPTLIHGGGRMDGGEVQLGFKLGWQAHPVAMCGRRGANSARVRGACARRVQVVEADWPHPGGQGGPVALRRSRRTH